MNTMKTMNEVREYPILFSAPMVRAILAGQKTQTRRPMKLSVPADIEAFHQDGGGNWIGWSTNEPDLAEFTKLAYPSKAGSPCPYGVDRGRMWVRETWAVPVTVLGAINYLRMGDGEQVVYRADTQTLPDGYGSRWRPSIFMPRWASRITLEIIGVRVERLQDITEEDAVAEGVGHGFVMNAGWPDYTRIANGVCELTQDNARMSFATLWDSINGKKYPWESNPWLWVVEFKVLEVCKVRNE